MSVPPLIKGGGDLAFLLCIGWWEPHSPLLDIWPVYFGLSVATDLPPTSFSPFLWDNLSITLPRLKGLSVEVRGSVLLPGMEHLVPRAVVVAAMEEFDEPFPFWYHFRTCHPTHLVVMMGISQHTLFMQGLHGFPSPSNKLKEEHWCSIEPEQVKENQIKVSGLSSRELTSLDNLMSIPSRVPTVHSIPRLTLPAHGRPFQFSHG